MTAYSLAFGGLLLCGAGLGLVFGCALNTATYGAGLADAGVASALVNTNLQLADGRCFGAHSQSR